jgi:hypothetical protein
MAAPTRAPQTLASFRGDALTRTDEEASPCDTFTASTASNALPHELSKRISAAHCIPGAHFGAEPAVDAVDAAERYIDVSSVSLLGMVLLLAPVLLAPVLLLPVLLLPVLLLSVVLLSLLLPPLAVA